MVPKSTLVKILYGHVKPDSGEILINSDLAIINYHLLQRT